MMFNKITDIIEELQTLQQQAEELFIVCEEEMEQIHSETAEQKRETEDHEEKHIS